MQGGLSLEERAHLDFALFLRRRWADRLYPALRAQYDAAVEASGTAPAEPKAARPLVHAQPSGAASRAT